MIKGRLTDKEKKTIKEMRDNNKSYTEIADALNCNDRRIRKYCSEHGLGGCRSKDTSHKYEDDVARIILTKYPRYEYVGGYTDSKGCIYLMCKDCGTVFKRSAKMLKPCIDEPVICPGCQTIISTNRKQTKEEQRKRQTEEKKLKRQLKAKQKERERLNKLQNKVCPECGKTFNADRIGKMYCGKECQKRVGDRNKALKKRNKVMANGEIDWGISLTKLIKRDSNTCHICGGKCDKNDYTHDDKGSFIAGRNYPSVDHVNPIAKGGTHTWDNVKLAHFRCNSLKRDKLCYEGKGEQMTMVV